VIVALALGILYEPVSENFFWAQLQIVLFFLLALNFRWMRAGKDAPAGLALAMAILLKAFPAILLVHFIVARRVRLIAWTAAGIAAGALLTLLLVGNRSYGFLHPVSTTSDAWWKAGLSVSSTIRRIVPAIVREPHSPAVTPVVIALVAGIIILIVALGVRATIYSTRMGRQDASYALWMVLSVFLFPITWIHHMVLLLIPFTQIALATYEGDPAGSAPALALASYAAAEMVLPLFWIYWLTRYVPLLAWSAAIAQVSGLLAACAAYRLACQPTGRVRLSRATHDGALSVC
jgi:hypothetical protein